MTLPPVRLPLAIPAVVRGKALAAGAGPWLRDRWPPAPTRGCATADRRPLQPGRHRSECAFARLSQHGKCAFGLQRNVTNAHLATLEHGLCAFAMFPRQVNATLASYLITGNKQPAASLEHQLTARELAILARLAAGETDRHIASQLLIATATLNSHLERIRDKTGARRRAQLTRLLHCHCTVAALPLHCETPPHCELHGSCTAFALKLHWYCIGISANSRWNCRHGKHAARTPGTPEPKRQSGGDPVITALSIVAVFGIIVFLSGAAFGIFILFVISLRRTPRGPLSQVQDERVGGIARRVLTGSRPGRREISQ